MTLESRVVGEGWTLAPAAADGTSHEHIKNMQRLLAVGQRNPSFMMSNEAKTYVMLCQKPMLCKHVMFMYDL